jgi:hypothetical protein
MATMSDRPNAKLTESQEAELARGKVRIPASPDNLESPP